MNKIEWYEGEPTESVPGMLLMTTTGMLLIGHISEFGNAYGHADKPMKVLAWAWAFQPYELDHIEDLRRKHTACKS